MRNPQEVEPLLTPPSTPLIDGVEYTSATDSQNPTASIKSILRSSSNYVAPKQASFAVDSNVNDSRKLKKNVSWSDLNPGGSLVEIKMVPTEKKLPPKKETHWKGLLCSAGLCLGVVLLVFLALVLLNMFSGKPQQSDS